MRHSKLTRSEYKVHHHTSPGPGPAAWYNSKMSNFLAKIKASKKKNKVELPPQQLDVGSSASSATVSSPNSASVPVPPIESSPTSPEASYPVQNNSIFSGLHLTSKCTTEDSLFVNQEEVTKQQQNVQGSKQDVEDQQIEKEEISSFSFLATTEIETVNEEFIPQEDDSQEKADDKPGDGFSFLDQPVAATVGIEAVQPALEQIKSSAFQESLESSSQSKLKTSQKVVVNRSTAATNEKKKKRKAIRPGQGVIKEELSTVSSSFAITTQPIESEVNAVTEPTRVTEITELPTVTSQLTATAELPTVTAQPTESNEESIAETSKANELEASGGETTATDAIEMPANNDYETTEADGPLPRADVSTSELYSPEARELSSAEIAPVELEETPNYDVQFDHEESLAGLLQSYASGLSQMKNEFSVVEETHKTEVVELMGIAKQQVDRWVKNHLLREKEAKALAEEDYELAEQLSSQLDELGVKPEQDIVSIALPKMEQWIQECSRHKEAEVTFQKEIKHKLNTLREHHSMALEELKKAHASVLAKEKMQMQSLVNKVEREAGHIALDCSHLEKREQLLKEETSRRAVSFIATKEKLVKDLAVIESEIDSLEAKLALLRNQKSDVVASIEVQEEHIRSVEDELSEEKNHLQSEREALQERQDQLSKQQDIVLTKQHAVEEIEEKQYKEQCSLEKLISQSSSVWDEVKEGIAHHEQSDHHIKQLLGWIEEGEKLLKPSQQLIEARSVVERKKQEIEAHTKKILAGQNELGEQRRKVQAIKDQFHQLLESKKAAVTGRQFKEASRLAGESKTVGTLLEQEQSQLCDAEQNMLESSKRLAQLSDELSKCREDLLELERTEDEIHMQDLLQAGNSLSNLSEVLNDFLKSVISTWSQLYSILVQSLQSKHGFGKVEKQDITGPCGCEVDTIENTGKGSGMEEQNALLVELEKEIEEACQEENYDRAAELEEKLQSIKMNKKEQ